MPDGTWQRTPAVSLALAKRAGATVLGLHTSRSMASARRMYQKMGFLRAPEHDEPESLTIGPPDDPVSIDVDRRELITAFHTDAGMNVLLDIEIEVPAGIAARLG